MKNIYFVTATNTDVGKSYASEVLLKRFAKDGKKVGYFKPIETGVVDKPLDGTKLLNITKKLNPNFILTINDIVPYQFKLPAAPFIAKGTSKIDISFLIQKAKELLKYCDILIIEGAGGLMVPIEKNYFMIDLILKFQKVFNSKTILISPSNLGSINDTMLSQKMLENYNINYQWYINLYKDKDSFETITLPFYKEYFDKISFL
ncbi:MAG: dethiobiotin synthase [Epsilonproteobacteria bacterium]|nr:MAG: dethiobiotin synthase [Campylobacterota bacterium]